MSNLELKQQIVTAYTDATPDMLSRIKGACAGIEQEGANEPDMLYFGMAPKRRKKNVYMQKALAMAASFALVLMAGIAVGRISAPQENVAVDPVPIAVPSVTEPATEEATVAPVLPMEVATIYLDVNPSVELTIDEKKLVVRCDAGNADAEVILQNLNLSGVEFHTALNAIVGSMYMNGYLQGGTDAMLVSVDTKVEGLTEEITLDVDTVFSTNAIDAVLIVQDVDSKEYEEKAKEQNVSAGKMEYVEKIIDSSEEYVESDIERLSGYTIRTLHDILNVIGIDDGATNPVPAPGSNPGASSGANPGSSGQATPSGQTTPSGDLVGDTMGMVNEIVDTSTDIVDETVKTTTGLITDITNTTVDYLGRLTGQK